MLEFYNLTRSPSKLEPRKFGFYIVSYTINDSAYLISASPSPTLLPHA
jgi:hypothetical protein